jgi:hypothetical protein
VTQETEKEERKRTIKQTKEERRKQSHIMNGANVAPTSSHKGAMLVLFL